MTEQEYLKKISEYRNKLCRLLKEGEKLADEGEVIKGEYTSCDFEADHVDDHDTIGCAFGTTNELELVVTALYHFIEAGGKPSR